MVRMAFSRASPPLPRTARCDQRLGVFRLLAGRRAPEPWRSGGRRRSLAKPAGTQHRLHPSARTGRRAPPQAGHAEIQLADGDALELRRSRRRRSCFANADASPTSTIDSRSGCRYVRATRWMSSTVTALTRSRNVCSSLEIETVEHRVQHLQRDRARRLDRQRKAAGQVGLRVAPARARAPARAAAARTRRPSAAALRRSSRSGCRSRRRCRPPP